MVDKYVGKGPLRPDPKSTLRTAETVQATAYRTTASYPTTPAEEAVREFWLNQLEICPRGGS